MHRPPEPDAAHHPIDRNEPPGAALKGVAIGILLSAPFWIAVALWCDLI